MWHPGGQEVSSIPLSAEVFVLLDTVIAAW